MGPSSTLGFSVYEASSPSRRWFNDAYHLKGFAAQCRYPNEELIRFFARNYFPLEPERRRAIRVLEAGCGAGANLWMVAREGFETHGIDQSLEAVRLALKMTEAYQASATVTVADMTAIPYPKQHFDVIFDVFSSYCLDESGFSRFLGEVKRLLRRGGRFFSYTPSKESDAFKDPGPSKLLDASTLDGIRRKDSHHVGNIYPFRFIAPKEYVAALKARGLQTDYCETLGLTYGGGKEYFEFVVVSAMACGD